MTDSEMTRPAADDNPKDPDHAPAVEPAPAGDESGEEAASQGEHESTDVHQTGGKVANPYME